jgi:glycosyltransferase involved in cell wall biosynthesis
MLQEPIRNLQIISSPGIGGREIDVPVLARKLIGLGHPTWIMCRPGTLVEKLSREWGLPIVPTRMNWYFNPFAILVLARFLIKHRIQIIHAHWSRDLSNLILAAGLAGEIPIVLTKHVYSTEKKHDFFHNWIYRHIAKVIAISDLVAENVAETVCLPRQKIITIYNGIELQKRWNPELIRNVDLRADFGVPAGKPIVGYLGRLNKGKGLHYILEAFSRLAEDFPEWHLVFVGKAVGEQEQAYAQELRVTAEEYHLQNRVYFVGYRTDAPAVMSTFSLLVNASEFESLGMVMVEAMAMERPVIGPGTGGVKEIIESGRCGELYEPGNSKDLTIKLRRLMCDSRMRLDMGKQGRQIVLRKFNLDLMAGQVLAVFRDVLQKNKT